MQVEANHPVVKLCAAGIGREMAGRREQAAGFYQQAWEARASDYDACIVAHYLARVQSTPPAALHWNLEALRYAQAVNDGRVEPFYPSLYLNLGKAHEDLGQKDEARRFYALAERKSAVLGTGAYAETVRQAIAAGRQRVAPVEEEGERATERQDR
jgi:tetratricopeptide (TPR) repeat protein